MNLWKLFPTALVSQHSLAYLPYLSVALYLALTITLFLAPKQRLALESFLLFSLLTNLVLLFSLGPSMSGVIGPLMLLCALLLPVLWRTKARQDQQATGLGSVALATSAALVNALSWGVWVRALAGS